MKKFKVGQKVKVPHGQGVIVGFEKFDNKGMCAPLSIDDHCTDCESRVVVKLESGHAWSCKDELYCSFSWETTILE